MAKPDPVRAFIMNAKKTRDLNVSEGLLILAFLEMNPWAQEMSKALRLRSRIPIQTLSSRPTNPRRTR